MYFCIPKLKDLKLFRKKDFVALVFISLFSMGTIALFYQILKPNEVLPIYQPNLVNEKLVDSTVSYVSKYHTIADFNLINQNGEEIKLNNSFFIKVPYMPRNIIACPK